MGGEFTRLASLVAGLITHAVPLSKNGGGSHIHHPAYHSRRVLLMGYNGLHTRDPGAPFACSEPISTGFGIGLFAAVTNKALWRIGRWHPSRLGGLGDGTETTIRHEAVVGETPCPENDCSTSRYDRSSLPAQHVHRRGSRLSNSAGRDQRQAQQG